MKETFLNWLRELLIVPFMGDRENLPSCPSAMKTGGVGKTSGSGGMSGAAFVDDAGLKFSARLPASPFLARH